MSARQPAKLALPMAPHVLISFVVLLGVPAIVQAQGNETGGGLGAPPREGAPATDGPSVDGPSVDRPSVDSAVLRDDPDATANTHAPPSSNDEIPTEIPPPPQSGYTVPQGYGNNPPPRFVPTQGTFQPVAPIPRRVRVRVREGTQIPPDAHVFERRSRFLLVAGSIAFAVGYAISLSAGIIDEDRLLYAPLVGPLLWQLDEGTSDTAGLMALLTLAQTAGVILFSFGMRKKTYAEWYAGVQGGALTLRNVW